MPKKALIVDDNKERLSQLKKVLGSRGYDAATASTLTEAKNAVISSEKRGEKVGLIITDLDFGRKIWNKRHFLDGFRFAMWCRKKGINSKIILHSTAFESRLLSFLFKPVIMNARKNNIIVRKKADMLKLKTKKQMRF